MQLESVQQQIADVDRAVSNLEALLTGMEMIAKSSFFATDRRLWTRKK